MSLNSLLQKSVGRRKRCRQGWLGIDIGTRSVKVAEVSCDEGRWKLLNRFSVSTPADQPLDRNALRNHALKQVLEFDVLGGRTIAASQRAAAVVLSMDTTSYQCLHLPDGSEDELRAMAGEELSENETDGQLRSTFDLWQSKGSPDKDSGVKDTSVLSLDEGVGCAVYEDLCAAGLHCHAIDGLPFALARAAQMATPDLIHEPVAILDWGNAGATFVVARAGVPCYTRILRGNGVGDLAHSLAHTLKISDDEALQLLAIYGLRSATARTAGDEMAWTVDQLITPGLRGMLAELQKTLLFVKHAGQDLEPVKILLCGGGACIRNVGPALCGYLGLDVADWALDSAVRRRF